MAPYGQPRHEANTATLGASPDAAILKVLIAAVVAIGAIYLVYEFALDPGPNDDAEGSVKCIKCGGGPVVWMTGTDPVTKLKYAFRKCLNCGEYQ